MLFYRSLGFQVLLTILQSAIVLSDDWGDGFPAHFKPDQSWKVQVREPYDIEWDDSKGFGVTISFGSPDVDMTGVKITVGDTSWPWEHTDVTITGDLKLEESYWFALQHKMSHKWDFSPRLFFDQHGNAHREEEPNDLQRKILLHMVDKTAPDPLATTKSESSESSETTSSKDGSTATTLFESTQEGEEVPKSTEDSTSKAHTTSVTSATQSEASSSSLRTASAPSRTAEPPSTTRQGAHGSSSSNSLALGAKIGIGVAAGVGGLSTVVLVGMLICRRRRGRNPKEADQAVSHGPSMAAAEKPSSNHLNTPEVASNPIFELAADQVWTGGEGPEGTNTTPHKVVENRWQKRWSRGRSDVS